MTQPARVLVTGGAGFIGSHLVDGLLAEGARVRVLDDLSSGSRENLAHCLDRIDFLEGDLRDPDTVERAVAGRDLVYHQAASASVARSVDDPLGSHGVNVRGTLLLLEAARRAGVSRLVFAGSCAVYGVPRRLPLDEASSTLPLSPYALEKETAEAYCRLYTELYGLETVVLRYFNVYGPRQDPKSDYAAVVPLFVQACRKGEAPRIFGDGSQTRDFVFVGDVVRANLLAGRAPGVAPGVFNVAGGRETSVRELFSTIRDLAGARVEALNEPPRPGEVPRSLADVTRAERELSFRAEVELREGLRRTLAEF